MLKAHSNIKKMKRPKTFQSYFLITIVAVLLLARVHHAKVVECSPDLTVNMNNRWQYCTKMAFAKDRIARVKATVAYSS